MEEQKQICVMQINMKNGTNVSIGVNSIAEYKAKRDEILDSDSRYTEVLETCTIINDDVSLIEFFMVDEKGDAENG